METTGKTERLRAKIAVKDVMYDIKTSLHARAITTVDCLESEATFATAEL